MATRNPFDLLDDDDNGDPSSLLDTLAAAKDKPAAVAAKKQQPAVSASGKLPSKPLPPAQAVKESRVSPNEGGRGRGGGRGGRGFGNRESQEFGRGRGGGYNVERNFNRENNAYSGSRVGFYDNNSDLIPSRNEDGDGASNDRGRGGGGGRAGGRGGRGGRGPYGGRGGFGDEAGGDDGRRRAYERRSGSGRGFEMKREGSGRGNWGSPVDQGAFQETEVGFAAEEEKTTAEEKPNTENNQETPAVIEEKKEEEEDKEMTLDEYEKVLEEKRKALLALKKVEERKVDVKEFESMQVLSNKKKDEDALFIKLGPEKEKSKNAGENERVKKSLSINEFLKPAEGERYYSGGRGRGRGRGERGERGGFRGGYSGAYATYSEAPSIEDPRQFPTLGGK